MLGLLSLGPMHRNDEAMEKIRDLTLLSDIFPTGYHGAVSLRDSGCLRSISVCKPWRYAKPQTPITTQLSRSHGQDFDA